MNFGAVRRVKLFCFLYLSYFVVLVERFVYVFFLKLDMLFCLGMSIRRVFQGILVDRILAIEVLFFFLFGHEKSLRQLWILLFEYFFFVGRQTCNIVRNAEFRPSFFNFLLNNFLWRNLNIVFLQTTLLLRLLLWQLLGGELFDFRGALLYKFGEKSHHVIMAFNFHELIKSF